MTMSRRTAPSARPGLLAAGVVTAAVVWATVAGGGLGVLRTMMGEPLYLATLVDLYAALALFAGWIWIRERSPLRLLVWSLAMVGTGAVAAGIYTAWAAHQARGDLAAFMLGRSRPGD